MQCRLHIALAHQGHKLSPKGMLVFTPYVGEPGAGDGDRTRDFLLGKEMLYH